MKKKILYSFALLLIAVSFMSSCKKEPLKKVIDNGIEGSYKIKGWAELPYLKFPQDESKIESHEVTVGRDLIHHVFIPKDNDGEVENFTYYASNKMDVVIGVFYKNHMPKEILKTGAEQLLLVDKVKFKNLLLELGFKLITVEENKVSIFMSDKYDIVFGTMEAKDIDTFIRTMKTFPHLEKTTGAYIVINKSFLPKQ